ncbi:sterol 26-hydroxylase, mitochondrial-like [Watersipora subatra]|uniref:sterol 26-hydroxylase, mitochondrial-like n=1 Tax=Watersipora subatra TaxID=2589382 RepID=UPI00355C01C5
MHTACDMSAAHTICARKLFSRISSSAHRANNRHIYATHSLLSRVTQWEDLPGPVALPKIGSMHVFAGSNRHRLHIVTKDLVDKYGKVIRLTFGSRAFAVADANLMEEVLRQQDPVPFREPPLSWVEYLNKHNVSGGLLTSQDEDWARKRKSVQSLMLKPFTMEDFVPCLEKLSEDFCNHIELMRDESGYVDSLPLHLYRFAFDGIVSIIFGQRAGCLAVEPSKRGDEFISAVSVILESSFNSLMIFAKLQLKYNTKKWQQHEQAWDKTKDSTQYFLEKMMDRLDSSSLDFTPMASSLLANSALSRLDTEYMLMEFLFGGVDTSSNTLGFMLYLLASHPEKQEKLRAEILEHSDHLDIHVVKNLKYLNMCIKETLRLYPILFINGRTIRKDFVSQKGIQFKAEDKVMFWHYCICRDPDVWQNPDEFIPERFDRNTTTTDSPERKLVSIPFGFGTRACIGRRIAELEIALCIIKVLTQFNLTLDKSKPVWTPLTRALLTPGKQIPIKFNDLYRH